MNILKPFGRKQRIMAQLPPPGARQHFFKWVPNSRSPEDSSEIHTGIKGSHCLIFWGLLG